jgi:hypothetical protein
LSILVTRVELPQPLVHEVGVGGLLAEGVGNRGQGLAEVRHEHLPVGDVLRHFSQAVHVVGEGDQARLDFGRHGFQRLQHE